MNEPFHPKQGNVDIQEQTKQFPLALEKAIQHFGFIDEWAQQVGYNPTVTFHRDYQWQTIQKPKPKPHVQVHESKKILACCHK
jgi:hypothetical protein